MKALDQLHVSHMGKQKTGLLACASIYWININADIENYIKIVPICLNSQVTQPKDKTLLHESVRPDIFSINNKHYIL